MLENLDDDENTPPKWQNRDDDKDDLLSALQLYSSPNGHVQGRDGDTAYLPGLPVFPRQHNG